jgi:ABC-type cobalamin/Fe3+-siderophores transport system ATPase subunit
MKSPIYSINKISINKNNNKTLDIRKLDIHRGSCYVVYGDIGSGKSTLLNLLYKKEPVPNESIFYESADLNSISAKNYYKDVYHVSQDLKLPWFQVSVRDYIDKKVNSYPELIDPKKRVNNIISKMKLEKYLTRDYRKLSDGERRWVELAVSIACDTKVLLIDGFGQYLGEEKINVLSRILYRKINFDGVTVIIGTHVRERLARIASVFIRLEQGKIVSVRSKKKHSPPYKKYKK